MWNNSRLFTRFRYVSLVLLGVFVIINIGIYLAYVNKTYPNTYLNNTKIGKVYFANINKKITQVLVAPDKFKLELGDKQIDVNSVELGVSVDYHKINSDVKRNRHWLPVANYFIKNQNHASHKLDESKFKTVIDKISPELSLKPTPSKIEKSDLKFVVTSAVSGKDIDVPKSYNDVAEQLSEGKAKLVLAHKDVAPPSSKTDLNRQKDKLNNSLNRKLTISYDSNRTALSKQQIFDVLQPSDEIFVASTDKLYTIVDSAVSKLGVRPANRGAMVVKLADAINNAYDTEVVVEKQPEVNLSYAYCVAAKGVDASYLGALQSKLASVYADARGWGLGSRIKFYQSSGSCNFTVWLTAAELVPSFSPSVCDSTWSCRVGNNVIINFDRWSYASPAWNSSGGSLDDYRSMVINHETGHWFGFHHRFCGGAGQPAPVMQQQSISLQGCVFNPWPTAPELQSLRSSRGIY